MASEDPNRQENAPQTAPSADAKAPASSATTSPAEIEAAVARLSPADAGSDATDPAAESATDDNDAAKTPLPADEPPAEKAPTEPAPAAAPVPPRVAVGVRRAGPSPWLALPIGAITGALAGGVVTYGLVESGMVKPMPGIDMQPLIQRIGALEQRPRQDLAPSVAQLDSRVAQLEGADLKSALAATQAEVATLKQALAALTTAGSQTATLAQQAAGLADQVTALSKTVQDRATASQGFDRALGAVVTVGALREAFASGRPFASELSAVRGLLGPQAASLEPFAAAAAKGYPTPSEAAARLRAAARAPGAATGEAPKVVDAGSFVDRILSSAESLVKVQPADGAPRASDQKALDAAAAALASGDTAQALDVLDTLSPEARAKVQPVIADIAARRDALQAAATLLQQALAAISGKLP